MIIGLCLLLLVWLLWKEFRRANPAHLPARMIATALAVVGLACLLLPLSYSRKLSVLPSGGAAILLTEGYSPDSLRQLLQNIRKDGDSGTGIKIFSMTEESATPEAVAAGATGDIAAIKPSDMTDTDASNLARLHVLGYGLTRRQWSSLRPPQLIFHPSPFHAGIISVSWKQKLLPGEKMRVQGRVQLTDRHPAKLMLTGMGLPLDSVMISAEGSSASGPPITLVDFELNTIPAQSGKAVYQLYVLPATAPSTDTLERESLPIEVLPGKKLTILLLAATPDFENTFLANWLARNGHAVAIRTAISKDKWNKAFLNMPATSLDALTPTLLEKFDMVIADAAVLRNGSEGQRSALLKHITDKGMGLVIRADPPQTPTTRDSSGPGQKEIFYKAVFPVEVTKDSAQRLYLKEIPGTQPLLRDSLSRVVLSSSIYGAGKLLFTTLNNTYTQMLSGAKKEYAAYWSMILNKAARKSDPGEDWQFFPSLSGANEPVTALLQTNKNGLPQGQFGAVVYLSQDPWLPFSWQGTYWPTEAGWQSSATMRGDTSWWYAWSGKDWPQISRRQRWKETQAYIASQTAALASTHDTATAAPNPSTPNQTIQTRRVPIPKAWFYALFTLSCIFLWVERKI